MDQLHIGVIGTGRIGRMHIQNILECVPEAHIEAISDPIYQLAENFAAKTGNIHVYEDYRDLLKDPHIDAVLICTATNTHSKIAMEAAECGKNIFCEKPIDYDVDKIYALSRLVDKTGVKFQIGFNRRFDRNFMNMHAAIADGAVGDVHIVRITSRDPEAPAIDYIKNSGGMFLDTTTHDFDMVRFLTGSEIVEVSVFGTCLVDDRIGRLGDTDTCVTMFRLENGAVGVIDNSRGSVYGYDQRAEVFGSRGQIANLNETCDLAILSNEQGVIGKKPLYFFIDRYKQAYIAEIKAFIDACRTNTPPLAGIQDGLRAVLVGIAATKSFQMGGMPVKISYQ